MKYSVLHVMSSNKIFLQCDPVKRWVPTKARLFQCWELREHEGEQGCDQDFMNIDRNDNIGVLNWNIVRNIFQVSLCSWLAGEQMSQEVEEEEEEEGEQDQ